MEAEVAKVTEIPPGSMKKVRAFDQDVLLSNFDGKIYATSNRCGHSNASLARGTLQGKVVTCPLDGAKFDVTDREEPFGSADEYGAGGGAKLPPISGDDEADREIVSEIQSEPLKTFSVIIKGVSVFLEGAA